MIYEKGPDRGPSHINRYRLGFAPTLWPVFKPILTGPNGPKRATVGRHDVLHAERARRRAALTIARIKADEEPVPVPLAARAAGGPTP